MPLKRGLTGLKAYGICCLAILINACGENLSEPTIRIAAAANMQYAIKKLASDFTSKTGTACELIISSSGKLTAQIKEGAPYDIFVAADMSYPQAVYAAGKAIEKPKIYAYGKLVLWTYSESLVPTLQSLTDKNIEYIALANPETAPYGSAAISVLKHEGIYESVREKLVFGESIAQTNQFITSGAAEIGFTALAVVKASTLKDKGNWITLDENLYEPIAQGVVILKREKGEIEKTQEFYKYLFSKEAQKILSDFGYSVNE